MKDYDRSSYLKYLDMNNLYGWAMSQKLPVNGFKWIENTSQFNKDIKKRYTKESDEGYFFEVDVKYFKKLHGLHDDFFFFPE